MRELTASGTFWRQLWDNIRHPSPDSSGRDTISMVSSAFIDGVNLTLSPFMKLPLSNLHSIRNELGGDRTVGRSFFGEEL